MALSDAEIRKLKPQEKPYKRADERGLYLIVNPNGSRWWRFKYRFENREKGISLGVYPDVPLGLARQRRDEARQLVADGVDPSAARQADKASVGITFRAVADEWLAKQTTLQAKTRDRMRERLTTWTFSKLGPRPIANLTARDVLEILRPCEAKSTDTAHRVRSALSRIWRYAVATGRAERDITTDLRGALAPVKGGHFAALTKPADVAGLLRSIHGYAGQPATEIALQIAPYVFLRPGELRGGRWVEVDLDAGEWRIPGERMKMRRTHIVPLSKQVVALFRRLEIITGQGPLMFPSANDSTRPISDNTLNAALRRMGYSKAQMTAHGFRSTASSLLNEMGLHPDLIELQLAHEPANAVRGIYNRSERLEERRKMMQKWADHLDKLRAKVKL